MDVIGIVVVEDEEVLVSATGRDGELTRLVGVNVTGDRDASRVYVLAPWERLL